MRALAGRADGRPKLTSVEVHDHRDYRLVSLVFGKLGIRVTTHRFWSAIMVLQHFLRSPQAQLSSCVSDGADQLVYSLVAVKSRSSLFVQYLFDPQPVRMREMIRVRQY